MRQADQVAGGDMKALTAHHNTVWRSVKIIGAVACAAIALSDFLSRHGSVSLMAVKPCYVVMAEGSIALGRRTPSPVIFDRQLDYQVDIPWDRPHPPSWFQTRHTSRGAELVIPFWTLFLSVALPTAYAWHRCRRRAPGHCPKCGYDMSGLSGETICPECGTTRE
jgi:hypothetical protein